MEVYDDDLRKFEAKGAASLPAPHEEGYVENKGARIWYASYGAGSPVILLHGGLGHSGNWGYQVPVLVQNGYRAVLIDSRGHGQSSRDEQAYSYELMATDVMAVIDQLRLERSVLIGWSDGACTALIVARQKPERVAGVFFFACNMDPSGLKEFVFNPDSALSRCFARHTEDYAQLSATPDQFQAFTAAVGLMQRTQPDWSARELAEVSVPVAVVQGEHEEFIKEEHARHLAQNIPDAELIILEGVSHFAPLQRPGVFNAAMLGFVKTLFPSSATSVKTDL
jgi:pimeloyl-ACP methyl ester carboxylesterase